jgi:hypothetical protein
MVCWSKLCACKSQAGNKGSQCLCKRSQGKHSKTDVGSPGTLWKFEDNHLWHSGFPWDTILNNWPYFWAEWMPKLNFCSVGTKFFPSHCLLWILCPTFTELIWDHFEVFPFGLEVVRVAVCGIEVPGEAFLFICLHCFFTCFEGLYGGQVYIMVHLNNTSAYWVIAIGWLLCERLG